MDLFIEIIVLCVCEVYWVAEWLYSMEEVHSHTVIYLMIFVIKQIPAAILSRYQASFIDLFISELNE